MTTCKICGKEEEPDHWNNNHINTHCVKCLRPLTEHPYDPDFEGIVLFGAECAFNPDPGFKDYVNERLKRYEELKVKNG